MDCFSTLRMPLSPERTRSFLRANPPGEVRLLESVYFPEEESAITAEIRPGCDGTNVVRVAVGRRAIDEEMYVASE